MNKVLALSKAKNMVKIDEVPEGGTNVWYFLTPQVQNFIGNIPVGSEVEFRTEEKQGKKIINFIKAKGTVTTTKTTKSFPTPPIPSAESNSDAQFTCTECGATLKDDTYPTCYTCSMKLKAATNKSPEQQESIKRQAIGHMTSRTLIALQGTFDINMVESLISTIYDVYVKKIG